MEIANLWLPIFGCGIFITMAGNAWFSGHKIAAIWFAFAGVVCLLLLAAIQIQNAVLRQERRVVQAVPAPGSPNIRLVGFFTMPVQDHPGEPLKGWAIKAMFRNFGQADAKNVRVGYGHKIAAGAADFKFDTTIPYPPDAPLADIGPGVDFSSETMKFSMDVFDPKNSLILFGEVRRLDETSGGDEYVITEFCTSVVAKADPRVVYPDSGNPFDGPFEFIACPTHNGSRRSTGEEKKKT